MAGREHAKAVRAETGLPARRVLVEPMRRNTAMAIAYAAARIRSDDPDAVMVVLPADHVIPDGRAFRAAIRKAARAALEADVLVTLGVEPKRPDTGLGYIQRGSRSARKRRVFTGCGVLSRSPTRRRHGATLGLEIIFGMPAFSHGRCARFSMSSRPMYPISIARCGLCSARGGGRAPSSCSGSTAARRRSRSTSRSSSAAAGSGRCRSLSLERCRHLGVSRGGIGCEDRTLQVRRGFDLVECDSGANLVWSEDRTIALLGVEGFAVIDTPDALLVARLEQSSDVRKVVARLKSSGRSEIT